jgi:hypothetical protein
MPASHEPGMSWRRVAMEGGTTMAQATARISPNLHQGCRDNSGPQPAQPTRAITTALGEIESCRKLGLWVGTSYRWAFM